MLDGVGKSSGKTFCTLLIPEISESASSIEIGLNVCKYVLANSKSK